MTQSTSHEPSMTQISHTIGLARILLIVGLVFLHYGSFSGSTAAPFEGIDLHEHSFATWLNSFVFFFFFSSVPLLSMVSGWLFFSFMKEDAWDSIFRRMRRRFTSLYIPLVVWNVGYILLFYAAYRHNPGASIFTHSSRLGMDFTSAGWWDYVNAVTGLTKEPFAFQFWFVRDLFVTALITPLFWVLIERAPWVGAVVLGCIWMGSLPEWQLVIFERPDVPFFFYLGALVHQKRLNLEVPLRTAVLAFITFVVLAALRALAPCVVAFDGGPFPDWLLLDTRLMRLFGVVGCWGLMYRFAKTSRGIWLSGFGGLAFFLHSAHWPLLAVVKAMYARFIPTDTDGLMLLHDVLSVTTTVGIGLSAGLLLAKKLPRVFALMNGGRLLGQTKTHS